MATKEIDYEAAYKDLSHRVDLAAESCSALCKSNRSTAHMAKVFDAMKGFGDAVLVKHIK